MKVTAIAKIYWKLIKAGSKTYDAVIGDDKKEQVKELAGQEVYDETITAEEYEQYIGEPYTGELPPVVEESTPAEEVTPGDETEGTEEKAETENAK